MASIAVDEILREVLLKLTEDSVVGQRLNPEEIEPVLSSLGEAMGSPILQTLISEAVKVGQKALHPDKDDPESVETRIEVLDRMMNSLRFALGMEVTEDPGAFSEELMERLSACDALSDEDDDNDDVGAYDVSELDPSLLTEFLQQHQVTIDDIETVILGLEDKPDEESVGLVRRLLHTLKGDAGLVGLAHIESHVHALEDELLVDMPDLVERMLEFVDWMRRRFEELRIALEGGTPPEAASRPKKKPAAAASAEPAAPPPIQDYSAPMTLGDPEMTADFVTESNELLEEVETLLLQLESDRRNSESLNAVFRAFHTIKGLASFLELPHIKDLAHETESLLDEARSDKLVLEGAAFDATLNAFDLMKRMIGDCQTACAGDNSLPGYPKLGELLQKIIAARTGAAAPAPAASSDAAEAPAAEASATPADEASAPPAVEAAPKAEPSAEPAENVVLPAKEPAASDEKKSGGGGAAKAVGAAIQETIRVDPRRLDRLVDAIGELVIAESMVSQSLEQAGSRSSPEIGSLLGHMNKITRELQEMAMSLRMVPLRSTFRRMARLARDVAKKLGKRIEFQSYGDDAELDKTMVDAIGDPLMHMIRNAVDHGLEADVQERREANKSDVGQISIRAFHEGGGIYIEVADDGRGLNRDRILAKAIDRGLVREGDSLVESEILQLILEPGFSTAAKVSEVSGRGVGLDVVKRNIESLRGSVDVRSTPGSGTTFVIRLPLTLAVIEGMVVRVGRQRFVIPTLDIVRIIQPNDDALSSVFDRGDMLNVDGDLMPLFNIASVLDLEPAACEDDAACAVVVVAVSGRRYALAVDAIVGQQQIVIKSLGEGVEDSAGISGGAIMPDGRVGLILDSCGVVELAIEREQPALAAE